MPVKIKYLGSATLSQVVKGRVLKTRQAISDNIATLWRSKVSISFLSRRAKDRYSKAIKPYKATHGKAGAYISEFVANLLETGWKAFDMKPGLLKGLTHRIIPLSDNQGGVKAFRSVASSSPSTSWRHPGFKGAKIESRVRKSIGRIVRETVSDGK